MPRKFEIPKLYRSDLITSINPNHRLFFAKLDIRAIVNQRLSTLTPKKSTTDLDLAHALLNSIVGIFFIEALGFGRGLGVLDLSASRLKNDLKMLNPDKLTKQQVLDIKNDFLPLKKRKIEPIRIELKKSDRITFDNTVLESFGILKYKQQILDSFYHLYNMRTSI